MNKFLTSILLFTGILLFAQNNTLYWQQHVDYTMEINMNVENYQYQGKQKLVYTNNSPDTLNRVFYHLQFNAFQPGSQMDIRVQNLPDPDRRMVTNLGTKEEPNYESRISKLSEDEIGFIKVQSLKQDGVDVKHHVEGTILEVQLNTPLRPGEKTTLDMDFLGQVPVQIRRSGRNSSEGVALSMTQWYPKLAEYDFEGWHANEYIQREFHGVWGNFDVKITIDKEYILGGTGYLQNPNEIGHGYEIGEIKRPNGDQLTWHFVAPNVHDFTWAADPDFLHDTVQVPDGPTLHFLYQNDPEIIDNWKNVQPRTVKTFEWLKREIGPYPYKQYSVINGGDGGMEYAMCTLIYGGKSLGRLTGTMAHEVVHSWFHGVVANNEQKHPWMDEGFSNFFDAIIVPYTKGEVVENPHTSEYRGYFRVVDFGIEEPMTTTSDRHRYNSSYSTASYRKGTIFLKQLKYIIGDESFSKTIKQYYKDWSFKHPTPNDFIRVAEKVSGIELDWYLIDWVQTTNTIDYAVKSVTSENGNTEVTLENLGSMPMPVEVEVSFEDGSVRSYYIPLTMMRGEKPIVEGTEQLPDWSWVEPTYSFTIESAKKVASVKLYSKGFVADINSENDSFSLEQ